MEEKARKIAMTHIEERCFSVCKCEQEFEVNQFEQTDGTNL